jgi:hypothetical protein
MTKQHYTPAEREMRMGAEHLALRIVPQERGGYAVHHVRGPKRILRLSPLFATVAAAHEWMWEQREEGTEFRRQYDAYHEEHYISGCMKHRGMSEAEARAEYHQQD